MMPDICPQIECETPDFSACPNISIDYSIMEKATNVYVQLCDLDGQTWEHGSHYTKRCLKTETKMLLSTAIR